MNNIPMGDNIEVIETDGNAYIVHDSKTDVFHFGLFGSEDSKFFLSMAESDANWRETHGTLDEWKDKVIAETVDYLNAKRSKSG